MGAPVHLDAVERTVRSDDVPPREVALRVEMRALRRGDAEAWRPREPLAHAERPGRQVDVGEILIHLRAARILAPRAANAELGRTEVALEVGLRGDRRERGQRRERRLPLYRGARGEVEVGSEVR